MKGLPKNQITAVLNSLAADAKTYVPLNDEATSSYGLWSDQCTADLALDSLNTTFSPKGIVFPQTERLYDFAVDGQKVDIVKTYAEAGDSVLFGARACDRKAIAALDQVFLTRGYVDANYQARREHLTVIGRVCAQPGPFCFCSSMGVDPMGADGADVLLYENPDEFGWEPVTAKGQALTDRFGYLLAEKTDFKKPSPAACRLTVEVQGLPGKLSGLFEHPVWDELAARCINCGVCTYICPTCHCFDIQVENHGNEGFRFRCWDSCMYPEYNLMAGGHNPREGKRDRFRQRFLHKLEFLKERYGIFGCTGCGRCVAMCPNGNNIVAVINKLKEVPADV
jgi:ferredoxin